MKSKGKERGNWNNLWSQYKYINIFQFKFTCTFGGCSDKVLAFSEDKYLPGSFGNQIFPFPCFCVLFFVVVPLSANIAYALAGHRYFDQFGHSFSPYFCFV